VRVPYVFRPVTALTEQDLAMFRIGDSPDDPTILSPLIEAFVAWTVPASRWPTAPSC
jgi:hypothetical protein